MITYTKLMCGWLTQAVNGEGGIAGDSVSNHFPSYILKVMPIRFPGRSEVGVGEGTRGGPLGDVPGRLSGNQVPKCEEEQEMPLLPAPLLPLQDRTSDQGCSLTEGRAKGWEERLKAQT